MKSQQDQLTDAWQAVKQANAAASEAYRETKRLEEALAQALKTAENLATALFRPGQRPVWAHLFPIAGCEGPPICVPVLEGRTRLGPFLVAAAPDGILGLTEPRFAIRIVGTVDPSRSHELIVNGWKDEKNVVRLLDADGAPLQTFVLATSEDFYEARWENPGASWALSRPDPLAFSAPGIPGSHVAFLAAAETFEKTKHALTSAKDEQSTHGEAAENAQEHFRMLAGRLHAEWIVGRRTRAGKDAATTSLWGTEIPILLGEGPAVAVPGQAGAHIQRHPEHGPIYVEGNCRVVFPSSSDGWRIETIAPNGDRIQIEIFRLPVKAEEALARLRLRC
jgi:hypothetical protein